MEKKSISHDDVEDVQQLCDILKDEIMDILAEQELSIGVSALFMAVIEILFEQTTNEEQLAFWSSCFAKIFELKLACRS